MNPTSRSTLFVLLAAAVFGCEDTVVLDSRFVGPELAVDAFLNDASEPQVITLTESQDFFDNTTPTPVEDAQVIVCEAVDQQPTTNCFVFAYTDAGRYVWEPAFAGQTLGEVGTEFGLGIQRGEEQYTAVTTMNRTALIDSLSFQFEEDALGIDEGLYAQIYARDPVGQGDAYFIRSTINDTLLTRPGELSLAFDGTFSPGTNTDGITFILPVRFSINKTSSTGGPRPLKSGDHVAVEIMSLSREAYLFLNIVEEQVNNGQSGLFDLPVANSPSNIFNVDTGDRALGFFNVGAVVRIERTVEE